MNPGPIWQVGQGAGKEQGAVWLEGGSGGGLPSLTTNAAWAYYYQDRLQKDCEKYKNMQKYKILNPKYRTKTAKLQSAIRPSSHF